MVIESRCALPSLKEFPSEIETIRMASLAFGIQMLPLEIGRLDPTCVVYLQGCFVHPPKCYRGGVDDAMKMYFTRRCLKVFKGFVRLSVLFRRARLRAVERLFRPGGGGCKRYRENFKRSKYHRKSNTALCVCIYVRRRLKCHCLQEERKSLLDGLAIEWIISELDVTSRH